MTLGLNTLILVVAMSFSCFEVVLLINVRDNHLWHEPWLDVSVSLGPSLCYPSDLHLPSLVLLEDQGQL